MYEIELKDRLRNFRLEHGYSQQKLAEVLGVAISTYRGYENEGVLPKSDKLEKLAKFYGITPDQLLGIGTAMTFQYDKNDLRTLRRALSDNDLPLLQDTLGGLHKEMQAAIAPPDIPMDQILNMSPGTLRTIRFNSADEHLVDYASDREMQLRYAGHLTHDGAYYLQTFHMLCTVRDALESIENPFPDKGNAGLLNADNFRLGNSRLFARVLSAMFGYPSYKLKGETLYIFCMKGGKYIDVRGWTEDFCEFTADLPNGRSYTKDMIEPYTDEDQPDPEGERFAKWIIDRSPQYYDIR